MRALGQIKLLVLMLLLVALGVFAASCGGSKANNRTEANPANAEPLPVEVTTAAAIRRDLPRFFEATGSLAGDQQTDVAPQTSGKVVAVGVDIGSPVRRGQMLVRLDDAELKLRVEQAAAQVEQAKAAVRQAEEKIGLRPGQTFDPNRVSEVAAAKVEKDKEKLERMMQYGQSAMCRWRLLHDYFGEEMEEARCGNCDNCVHPLEEQIALPERERVIASF